MATTKKPASKGAVLKPPPGKSRSARTTAHDWALLLDTVNADSLRHPTIDFEKQYVHAIERALTGRDSRDLLTLLGKKRMIHPALLPALADVIRSQTDGAVGAGALLTEHQDRMIRSYFDAFTYPVRLRRVGVVREDLADLFHVSSDLIERSLNRTKTAK